MSPSKSSKKANFGNAKRKNKSKHKKKNKKNSNNNNNKDTGNDNVTQAHHVDTPVQNAIDTGNNDTIALEPVTQLVPFIVDSASWSGYKGPDANASIDHPNTEVTDKVHWPGNLVESNRSVSDPPRSESAKVMITLLRRRSSAGKETASPPSYQEAMTQTAAVDDNNQQSNASDSAASSPKPQSPTRLARTRSLEGVSEGQRRLDWADFQHSKSESGEVDSENTSEASTVVGDTDTQQESADPSPDEIKGIIIDVVEMSDAQSDTDSDKTATPTTMEHRQTVKDDTFESPPDLLREYLLGILEFGHFTDSKIVLKSFNHSFPALVFHTHKAIIARSPMVSCILSTRDIRDGEIIINITAGESFAIVKAFEVALQSLYGLPVLNHERLRQATLSALGYTEDSARINPALIKTASADFAVCYAASGAFFGNYEVVETGARLALNLIDWDTVELVVNFGLMVDTFLVAYFDPIPLPEQVGDAQTQINIAAIKDLREVWAPRLLTAGLDFVTSRIKPGFTLCHTAQVTIMRDRIPYQLRIVPGSILANPKLAAVKFGSFASLEKPSHDTWITSMILICLPFAQLKEMFAMMQSKQVLTDSLAREIIKERETRRLRALQAYSRQKPENQEHEVGPELKELGYKEFVTSKGRLLGTEDPAISIQITLDREWKGLP